MIRAVNGVTLSVDKGEILGLVGESGCGKSTLSRTIMQLQPADSGQISLDGDDLGSLSRREIRSRRLDFQMVFQDPYASLNPRMTVYSTLAEALCQRPLLNLRSKEGTSLNLRNFKNNLTERVAELMERVGLCLLYTSPSPRDRTRSRMPSSA